MELWTQSVLALSENNRLHKERVAKSNGEQSIGLELGERSLL